MIIVYLLSLYQWVINNIIQNIEKFPYILVLSSKEYSLKKPNIKYGKITIFASTINFKVMQYTRLKLDWLF